MVWQLFILCTIVYRVQDYRRGVLEGGGGGGGGADDAFSG